ncbi:3-phytase [Seminavis robusta]|uniref:3-phytase n=1 Tax=Seminavis robusta TaxID=568900 RepID=A0A9N8DUW5_9STRA|nr:3-phytase [Seminavis robusta]|eukprot:Sro389_g132700.1 3-phytase (1012) ;mRNA; f:60066-63383
MIFLRSLLCCQLLFLLTNTAEGIHHRIAAANATRTGSSSTIRARTARTLNFTGTTASSTAKLQAEAQRRANLRIRLEAKSNDFQRDQRALGVISSSDDVRREVEDADVEEELVIPKNTITPDFSLFGGISGITFEEEEEVYLAVPKEARYRLLQYDNIDRQGGGNDTYNKIPVANETDPVDTPRWYTLTFDEGAINITNVTYLRNPENSDYFYQSGNVTVQAITSCEGMIYVALDKGPTSPPYFRPKIVEYNASGHVMGTFQYPTWFNFSQGFTGLSVNPNEKKLYAATGDGLVGDESRYIRITEFDLQTRESGRQYVYESDLENVVGLVSLDDNGGFLVLERSDVRPEYNPLFGIVQSNPPTVGRTPPENWFGYNVRLYYALCLDAMNVQNISTGLQGFTLNTMRKELVREWSNVTKWEAIGLAGDHSTYRRKTASKSRRTKHSHRGLEEDEDFEETPKHRKLGSDSIDIILMADNEFVRDTEAQLLEVDIHEVPLLQPAVETEDMLDHEGETDERAKDPAIWIHPSVPEYSLIIGAMDKGLVHVYDMSGNLKQTLDNGDEASGVDVMYAFKLGNDKLVDIAIITDRAGNRIETYKINQEDLPSNNNILSSLSEGLPSVSSPGGVAAYTSPFTGRSYVFVIENDNAIKQIELKPTDNNERIRGDVIRTVGLPGTAGSNGIVVDQELGYIYVTIDFNEFGIVKLDAEPDEGDSDWESVASGDRSYFKGGDIEGLTLYYGDKGDGYLVVSVSGDSTFAVFERESDNDYYDSFTIKHNEEEGIDRVDHATGVTITNVKLGPEFKCGVFIAADANNEDALIKNENGNLVNGNTNFKLVPFEELAEKLHYYLDVDTDSWDPRRFALVIWINCIAQDVYSALNENKLSGRDTESLLGYLNEAVRHTYPRASKKQQMISRLDPFYYDDRRRSLEERRQETHRRLEEDRRGLRKRRKDCRRRRRLGVDSGKARDDLDDFLDKLQSLKDAGRLGDVDDSRYEYWKDLATGVKDQLHDDD